jgi:drug/metabolite transporter (DMT)-like permease
MALFASLGAALCYALASVLQQQAAAGQPASRSLRPALLLSLLRRPRWLVGIVADVAGFALQVVALANGSLALVQPLLVSGLLFALPVGAFSARTRLRTLEWLGAVELVAGLSLFLVVANPAEGHPEASAVAWAVTVAATVVPAALLVVLAGPAGPRRALCLGAATGLLYGLTAALTKASAHLLEEGVVHALTRWELYALVIVGLAGMLTAQSAFQAGSLSSSLPVLTALDPLASIAIGALAFGERLTDRGPAPLLEVLGVAAMVAGIFSLSRSQLVAGVPEAAPGPPADGGSAASRVGGMTSSCPRCGSEILPGEVSSQPAAGDGSEPSQPVDVARCVCCGSQLARPAGGASWELREAR